MTFLYPWVLLLILPLLWAAIKMKGTSGPFALVAKAASAASILIALAEPEIVVREARTGAVVLVDDSTSITSEDLEHASLVANEIQRHKGNNWVRIVPFDGHPRALLPVETAAGLHIERIADSHLPSATNIEAALMSSVASIPEEFSPRIVLLSDGNENEGSVARAIAQLQAAHVPVDTIPLAARSGSSLHIESVFSPNRAYTGEQIPIDLSLYSPVATTARLDLSAEGKPLGSEPLTLKTGRTSIRIYARVKTTGVVAVVGRISAPGLSEAEFEKPIELRRAKVLYLSQDPAETDKNFLQVLKEASFDVNTDWGLFDRDSSQFGLVVLNNLDLAAFTSDRKNLLERYAKEGGGLLLIGGERQVYKEDKLMDALDRALPAKLAPPDTPKGTCVALIVDKSSSMEGRKIELARLSAIGVVDHLRPIDSIGVLMFDNSYQWAVPMRHAEDKPLIKRLISGITPDGGTQIAPALAEAYRRVLLAKASFKHIVLLTDGISEEGDSLELAKESLAHDVTISTVGLGQDVNRAYLEKIAAASGGRSYFLNEPVGLEQILLKDVQTFSGSTAVEKPLTPIVADNIDVLDGVGMDSAPALKGYVRFISKPGTETPLQIDNVKKDPLYVRWQYGLGRAGVFTSDAKSRWAESWVSWPGFDKFWINVTRDLLAHTDPTEATAEFDSANADIQVRYQTAGHGPEPQTVPEIFVFGPNGFRKPIKIEKISAGLYGGRLHIGQEVGLFRVRPVNESSFFPEVGLYRQSMELQDQGPNEDLLRQISSLTNGRFNPSPETILEPNGRSNYVNWHLWPLSLGLALILTIAELIARKWSGLVENFQRRIA